MKCQICKEEKYDGNFYKIIKVKKNDKGVYQRCIICKDCIKKEYLLEYKKVNDDFKQALLIMCEKYNIYYDESLMLSIKENNIEDGWNLFQQYIRYISSLIQYQGFKFEDSVFEVGKIHTKTGISNELNIKEKSDIDFINDDIKELKVKISNALQKEDFNAHNKWMNSLRDALELRDKLNGNNDCTINIGTIMVKDDADISKLSEELSKLLKRDINYK